MAAEYSKASGSVQVDKHAPSWHMTKAHKISQLNEQRKDSPASAREGASARRGHTPNYQLLANEACDEPESASSSEQKDSDDEDFVPGSSSQDSDCEPPSISGNSDTDSIAFPLLDFKVAGSGWRGVSQASTSKVQCAETVELWGGNENVVSQKEHDVGGGEIGLTEETGVHLSQRGKGKYKWDKKHACKFCSKLVLKMSTHLQDVHADDEAEVAKILSMKKGTKERRQAWIRLQDEGDYMHNIAVLEKKSGCLIPKYRTKSSKVEDLLACSHCKGLYQKKLISVHSKHCCQKPGEFRFAKRGDAARLGRLMLPIPLDVDSSFYHKVLARQRDDEIRRLITTDPLLLEYGKRLFDRRDIDEHTAGQISSRMRELGRLLKILRVMSEMKIASLNAVINSASFNHVVLAVKELAEFDEDTHQFKKGNLAMRIGHSLKKCSQIKMSRASKQLGCGSDERWLQELSEAERFDSVFAGDWYDCVSATAAQSVGKMAMNKPKLIPSCEDVTKVQELLETRMGSEDYPTVVKATLCAISLFNRKRGGELQRMKVSDFQNAKIGMITNQDILKGLTEVEKKMVNHFQRVEIRGKFNRSVPILLTKKMMTTVERILRMRQSVPALASSQYIFATPSGQRPYRGHDVLKEHALQAQVSNPAMFTFTQLRKQVATLAQSMAISELDQDQLADFLGHDIRIHRHIYRQPQDVLQKAKVAKILLSVNNGMTDFESCIRDELGDEEIDFDNENTSETCREVSGKKAPVNEASIKSTTQESSMSMTVKGRAEPDENVDSFDDDSTASAPVRKKARFSRKPWGKAEEKVVQTRFKTHLVMNKLPGKAEIEHAIAEEPALRHRRWTNIKDYIRNRLNKFFKK